MNTVQNQQENKNNIFTFKFDNNQNVNNLL